MDALGDAEGERVGEVEEEDEVEEDKVEGDGLSGRSVEDVESIRNDTAEDVWYVDAGSEPGARVASGVP